MTWVLVEQYEEAHRRWDDHWPEKQACTWGEFLGKLPTYQHNRSDGTFWGMSDASAERVKLIATSPHYVALLKAMAVQYMDDPMLFARGTWK